MGFLERNSTNLVNWLGEKFSVKNSLGVVISSEERLNSEALDLWVAPYKNGEFGALKKVTVPKVCPDLEVELKVSRGMIVSTSFVGVSFPSYDELELAGVDFDGVWKAYCAINSSVSSKN